jgi:glucose-6-phosphate isomerase
MLPKINPTSTSAWQGLEAHFSEMKPIHLRDLFHTDPDRFKKIFSLP